MIIKKLSDVKGGGFPGAKYNEDKVAAGVAELMLMANVSERPRQTVETMHCFGLYAAAEVERYLKERSKTYGNTNTDRFQFHMSASVEGRTMTPKELADFARELMKGMGYDKQPYFDYAHHDTDNNHVHILSTRIQPNGYAISDHQDIRRMTTCANWILASDISKDIDRIFSYGYETEGQFANIVRAHGYKMEKSLDGYRLFKNGGDAGNIDIVKILNGITKNSQKRKERATQLRTIIKKYKSEIAEGKSQSFNNPEVSKSRKKKPKRPSRNPDIKKILDGKGNPLSKEYLEQLQQLIDILKKNFGIDIFFQKDKNGQIRGYGIVDHAGKIAFDGSKVMKLSDLIDFNPKRQRKPSPLDVYQNLFTPEIGREGLKDYVSIQLKDGSSYRQDISAKQAAWYNGVKPEDKEDVALRIASTMFQEQILVAYLNQDANFDPVKTMKSVTAFKQRDGSFAYRIALTDGFNIPAIPMTADESDRYRRLTPDNQSDFLRHLAIQHLTNVNAQDLAKRIKVNTQSQLHVNTLPLRPEGYSPEIISSLSNNLAQMITRFNVNIAQGQNREWEVGKHNPYDNLETLNSYTHHII